MPLTPTQKGALRRAISQYCATAEQNRLKWTYIEQRPFHGYGLAASDKHIADCSAYCSLVFNAAMHATKIYLDDPLGEHYSGYGNTDTALHFLKAHPAPPDKYLVGDFSIFGSEWHTIHMSVCEKAGTAKTALFSSNGHGSTIFDRDAPEPVILAVAEMRQHLVGVYRHPALL